MTARVKKNDMVTILSGKDKGKTGTVIEISPKNDTVMVKGVGIITKHVKARQQGDVGGIKKKESHIPLSIVMPNCNACKKPARVQAKLLDDGKKVRVCHRCTEIF